MRLKTASACCAIAWSPSSLGTPAMVAAASFSGAMSDDFDNTATLDLLLADVTQTDQTEMPVVGRIAIPDRASRVDWSSHGGQQGIIAVACTNGKVYIYAASAILKLGANGSDGSAALVWTIAAHQSPVRACQFNVSQPHFLATGDDSGAWLLWNLPKPSGKAEELRPLEMMQDKRHSHAVVHLQWHPRYPHIIATAAANGAVNAWNLKSESLVTSLHVSKASRGAGATCIAWNPTAATQLAVGLDDTHPVVQIWDLKCAMSPVRELRGHTRSVTGIAWCMQDASMLASCGGDGRTIWWDPATGANCGELQPEASFLVDVQWCPVLRGVLATSSFAPLLCVSTAQPAVGGGGGGSDGGCGAGSGGTSGESGGANGVGEGGAAATPSVVPKWLIPPMRASANFALVVASLAPDSQTKLMLTQVEASAPMSPMSSKDLLLKRELASCPPGSDERIEWLRAHHYPLLAALSSSRRGREPILDYLTRSEERMCGDDGAADGAAARSPGEDDDPFAQLSQEQHKSYEKRATENICSGRIEEALEVCLDNGRFADAFAMAFLRGGPLPARVHKRYVEYVAQEHRERRHVLIAGAIASGDFSGLVAQDVPWQEALATIIAYIVDGFTDACNRLGDALKDAGNAEGAYACYVCGRNVDGVIELWRLQGVPSRTVVQDTILLEETTGTSASSPYLAQCLCGHGLKLVNEGHPHEALEYLHRAARIGDPTAAVLVDRMRYILGGTAAGAPQTAPPYRVEPIADQPSAACSGFLARLHEQQQQQQQQRQQMAQQPPMQQQTQQRPPVVGALSMMGGAGGVPGAPPPRPAYANSPLVQQPSGPGLYGPATSQGSAPHAPPTPMHPTAMQQPQQQPPPAGGGGGFTSSLPPPPLQQQQQQRPSAPVATVASSSPAGHPGGLAPSSRPPLVASAMPQAGGRGFYDPQPRTAAGGAPPPPQMPAPSSASPAGGSGLGGPGAPIHSNGMPPPPSQQQQQTPYPPQPQPPGSVGPAPVAAKTPVGPPQPRLMPHPVSAYSAMRNTATTAATNSGGASMAPPPPPPQPGSASRGGSMPGSFSRSPTLPSRQSSVTMGVPQQPQPQGYGGTGGQRPMPPPPPGPRGPPPPLQQQQQQQQLQGGAWQPYPGY